MHEEVLRFSVKKRKIPRTLLKSFFNKSTHTHGHIIIIHNLY
jgi:hypothetical protein